MLDYTGTALAVIWAGCFRTGTFGYIFTIHAIYFTIILFFYSAVCELFAFRNIANSTGKKNLLTRRFTIIYFYQQCVE
jgi:hypothetical protein